MPKLVDIAMDKLGKSLGMVWRFYPSSTNYPKYLTNQVFFIRRFFTSFSQAVRFFAQALSVFLHLYLSVLCPQFTGSITNTKLIKELHS